MSYIPHDLYSLWLFNHDGEAVLFINNWTRAEYHQRLNSSWNHQITVEISAKNPLVSIYRNIQKDWILHIYRTDPVTLVTSRVYEGFNTTVVDQLRVSGDIIFNLYGVGYTDLLRRRVVVPTENSEYNTQSGPAESVIKAFVASSIVSPTDVNRTMPGVVNNIDLAAGNTVTYDARYTILYSVCEKVAGDGNIDFGIYGGSNVGEFIFDAREIWGTDRRKGNPEGNKEVEFSVELDNMLIPILSTNTSAEQNYAYVGGGSQGLDRMIIEVSDAEAISESPWGRKEFFAEARQQNDLQALLSTGQEELEKRKATKELTFNVRQTAQSRWIQNWELGDLVSARYGGFIFDKQIEEIGVVVTAGETAQQEEVITVELADFPGSEVVEDLELVPAGSAVYLTYHLLATTTAISQTITLNRITPTGENMYVDWGDGNSSTILNGNVGATTHIYTDIGTYTITLYNVRSITWWEVRDDLALGGDIGNWVLPGAINYFNMSNTSVTGDISNWVIPETMTQLFLQNTAVTGDVGDWLLPEGFTNIDIGNNDLEGDISGWELPSTLLQLFLYDTNFDGDISSWTLPAALDYLHLGNTNVSGDISGWDVSNLIQLYLYSTSVSGNVAAWTPTTAQILHVMSTLVTGDISGWALDSAVYIDLSDTTLNGTPDLSSNTALQTYLYYDCGINQANVVAVLTSIYNQRVSFVFATPFLNISGNDAPGGVYQDADPPVTGLEFVYELANNPDPPAFNTWTIIYTGGSAP